jgi:uncharacterized protein YjbI with pentapeptide repeats
MLTFGAGVFAAGALVYTARNFTLSREGQVTDRYTKAIEQLGSDKLDVRIGAVYALERIARDSATDHPTVMEVLAAFIREHSREQWPSAVTDESAPDAPVRSTRPDVQAALTVIGRRDPRRDRRRIDLSGANLSGASLTRADLSGANLSKADLSGAYLVEAELRATNLNYADLTGANVIMAHLDRAALNGTNLKDAVLGGAHLHGARLDDADLTGAEVVAAGLDGAYLLDANLAGADLLDSDLSRASLVGANLTDANLTGVDLTGADLTGARLSGDTPVPDGWVRDPDSGRLKRADTNPGGAPTDPAPAA